MDCIETAWLSSSDGSWKAAISSALSEYLNANWVDAADKTRMLEYNWEQVNGSGTIMMKEEEGEDDDDYNFTLDFLQGGDLSAENIRGLIKDEGKVKIEDEDRNCGCKECQAS